MRFTKLTSLLILTSWAIGGCRSSNSYIPTTAPKPVVIYRSAKQMAAMWPEANFAASPESTPVQRPKSAPELRKLPDQLHRQENLRNKQSAEQLLQDAKRDATEGPTPHGFIHAAQVYAYVPNKVYTVFTSPGYVTTIKLRPGEKLVSAAAGDTTRWIVDHIEAGTTDEPRHGSSIIPTTPHDDPVQNSQTLVLVKPRQPFLQTNLVLTTSERTYFIDLKSVEKPTYHSAVTWTYPKDELLIKRGNAPAKSTSTRPNSVGQTAGNARNYQYNILTQKQSAPNWTPNQVYDDGYRTHVQFPGVIDRHSLPPLFGVSPDGRLQMLNYRFDTNRYIINRLIDRAELRYGPHRVGIHRIGIPFP